MIGEGRETRSPHLKAQLATQREAHSSYASCSPVYATGRNVSVAILQIVTHHGKHAGLVGIVWHPSRIDYKATQRSMCSTRAEYSA